MNKFTTHSPPALYRPAAPPGAPMALQKTKEGNGKNRHNARKKPTRCMSGSQFEMRTYAYALHILLCMYVLTKLITRKMRLIFSNGQSPHLTFYTLHISAQCET